MPANMQNDSIVKETLINSAGVAFSKQKTLRIITSANSAGNRANAGISKTLSAKFGNAGKKTVINIPMTSITRNGIRFLRLESLYICDSRIALLLPGFWGQA